MNRISAFLSSVLALLCFSGAWGKPTQDIARESFGSVVLLIVSDANGQPLALGSGFLVRPGVIATNYHVIEGAAQGIAKLVGQPTKYAIKGVLAVDVANDLALLKTNEFLSATLEFADEKSSPIVGDTVYAVGNPRGLEGTFSAGIVSGLRELGSNTLVQISAPISPGSSGGPVLNADGRVIGVAVATYRGGQNLNFAIPIRYLRAMMTAPQQLSALGSAKVPKEKPIWASIGDDEKQAIYASHVKIEVEGRVSSPLIQFSVQNRTPFQVAQVQGIIVLRDSHGEVVDAQEFVIKQTIRPGLAFRQREFLKGGAVELADISRTEIRIISMLTLTD